MERLPIAYEDDVLVMARVDGLGLVGWRDAPRLEHIHQWHDLGRELARSHPGASACLDVVLRGTPRFTEEVRHASQALASDPRIFPNGFAHVVLVGGLPGSAVRAFINTVILVARPPVPAKVFGEVRSAAAWLHPRMRAHGWTLGELAGAGEALVSRLRVA